MADFEEWNDKMYDRVCKCGEKAQEGGYKYFALENCGKSLVKKKKRLHLPLVECYNSGGKDLNEE